MEIPQLAGWTYLLTYGFTLDIYGILVYKADDRGWFKWRLGCLRIAIDRPTGRQVLGYVCKEG